jgi:hypothetical protein
LHNPDIGRDPCSNVAGGPGCALFTTFGLKMPLH